MVFPDDWEYRGDITTDSTKVDSNESDFPYYFDLSNITATAFWNNVQSDGGDLRVTSDEAGTTQVPLEVVSIDTVGETGEIHFKDSTDSASNKTYYIWWRSSGSSESQPAVTGTYGRNNVWSAYNAVYHLNEASGTVVDSTGNNDGTNNGATTQTAAQLGDGYDFDGTNDYVSLGDNTTTDLVNNFTVQAFGNWDTLGTGFQALLNKGDGASAAGSAYEIISDSSGNIEFSTYNGSSVATSGFASGSSNTWYLCHGTYDGTTTLLYVDGSAQTGSTAHSGDINNIANELRIGSTAGDNNWFDGTADEVRLINSVLSSGWIGTENNMLPSNATFWTVGTFEAVSTEQSITFSATALLQSQDNTTTFSADTLLETEDSNPFTFTAQLQKQDNTSTFSADANVGTVDNTATFSADTLLQTELTSTFSFDAKLAKDDIAITFDADTLLEVHDLTTTFSADARVVIQNEITFDADALLQAEQSRTFSADALLEVHDLQGAFTTTAVLQTQDSIVTFDSDANVQKEQNITFSADATLAKDDVSITFTFDTVIGGAIRTFSIDAILNKTIETTFTVDANIITDFTHELRDDRLDIFQDIGQTVTLRKSSAESAKTRDGAGEITSISPTTLSIEVVLQPISDKDREKLEPGILTRGARKMYAKHQYSSGGTGYTVEPGDVITDGSGNNWRVETVEREDYVETEFEAIRKVLVSRLK